MLPRATTPVLVATSATRKPVLGGPVNGTDTRWVRLSLIAMAAQVGWIVIARAAAPTTQPSLHVSVINIATRAFHVRVSQTSAHHEMKSGSRFSPSDEPSSGWEARSAFGFPLAVDISLTSDFGGE